MIFSSLLFLFRFIPIFFLIYYVVPQRAKNFVLFLGSLVFYAWGEPVYVILMLFSTLSDYWHGLAIERVQERGKDTFARCLLISSVMINLGMLGFFKYTDFLIQTVNGLTGLSVPLLNLPLPIGISFYTFQTMSYTIDVYRKKVPAQRNIIDFGTFVALFPQLIAGPIVRYTDVAKQLKGRRVTWNSLHGGVSRFVIGLGKKVLLANQAGAIYDRICSRSGIQAALADAQKSIAAGTDLTMLAAWIGILCFASQIYFDFSGYSDMAVGLGKMLGFTFPENFNYPYIAKSVTEFWRRWHMTLSGWFKEYVYIPLGGNRKGIKRQLVNILIVWMLTGIWHGASWNFLLWGLWYAFFLILEKLFGIKGRIYTILVVLGGWVLFAMTEPESVRLWFLGMTGLNGAGLYDRSILYDISNYLLLFLLLILGSTPLPAKVGRRIAAGKCGMLLETVFVLSVFLLSVAFLVDASYNPFLYFRF